MKELKIFLVLVFFTTLVYLGVEPYAHSQMHASIKPANFDFEAEDKDFEASVIAAKEELLKLAQSEGDESKIKLAQEELDAAIEHQNSINALYDDVSKVMNALSKLEVNESAIDDSGCTGCHKIESLDKKDAGYSMGGQGFIMPDLSMAGRIYDEKFLAALIIKPALAMKNDAKFNDENPHPMSEFAANGEDGRISDDDAMTIANIINTLKEAAVANDALIAQKAAAISAEKKHDEEEALAFAKFYDDKEVFLNACARCHDMRYDDLRGSGFDAAAFAKFEEDGSGDALMAYAKSAGDLRDYMGSTPPDLSQLIRARDNQYLRDFINNTQKALPGTAMPRVGLNETAQEQVLSYMEQVGDSKKPEREALGVKIMLYFALLSFLAFLWKAKIWREL